MEHTKSADETPAMGGYISRGRTGPALGSAVNPRILRALPSRTPRSEAYSRGYPAAGTRPTRSPRAAPRFPASPRCDPRFHVSRGRRPAVWNSSDWTQKPKRTRARKQKKKKMKGTMEMMSMRSMRSMCSLHALNALHALDAPRWAFPPCGCSRSGPAGFPPKPFPG